LPHTIASLLAAHRADRTAVADTVARCFAGIRAHGDPALFISLREEMDALAEARRLVASDGADKPLFGVPVAVKDNIDVAGLPTTAGCPAFAYMPHKDATVVARLKTAGAIILGKTNLDQFATGLVGVRSPYGVPRNPFRSDLIPGGSSSGSAVAVAAGLVPVAIGTDTAGSGRVPAGLNNIVGLKPSLGLVSNTGVVPACRSLDCVSIFALTIDDAFHVLEAIAGPDVGDPFSRAVELRSLENIPPGVRIAVPRVADRIFFGDRRAEAAFETALDLIADLGAIVVEIDCAPFLEVAKLLYEGPWLAERSVAVGAFVAEHPTDVHPVTREIISAGAGIAAADAFRGFYRLRELKAHAEDVLRRVDAMMVPTAPAAYTIAEIDKDPIALNSRLGTYTNFANLLDLAGLAVPAAIASDNTPFGVTFLAPAGRDAFLASLGRVFHAKSGLALGATGAPHPPLAPIAATPPPGEIAVAVVGAHLSGMPLNGELRALGARFLQKTATAADYRLFALATYPPKPGLLRVAEGQGAAIEVELWALFAENFGHFVAAIPPPLSIGTLRLGDGREVKGFLVEAEAVAAARDISRFGGWRAFIASAVPA
jgi:allophanate hydrolase